LQPTYTCIIAFYCMMLC